MRQTPILTSNNNTSINPSNSNSNLAPATIGGSYFSSLFGSNDQQTKTIERPTKVESSPNDIPKEELLQLCMKLNKRLQALENKYSDLLQKHQVITQERNSLFEFLKSSINEKLILENEQNNSNNNNNNMNMNNIDYIKVKWIENYQEEKNKILKLQDEIKLLKKDLNNHNESTLNNTNDIIKKEHNIEIVLEELNETKDELEKLKIIEKNMKNSISNLEMMSLEKNQRIEDLEKLIETERSIHEEKLLFLRMQNQNQNQQNNSSDSLRTIEEISELKQTIILQKTQLDDQHHRIEIFQEQIRQYEKKILSLELELERNKEKVKELEKNNTASTILKVEQEALLNNLRKDLKNAITSKDEALRRIKEFEEYRMRAEGQLIRLVEYKEKAMTADLRLNENQTLISRLQTQLQTVETNYALKTAMLATVEAEIESLRDIEKKFKLSSSDQQRIILELQNNIQNSKETINKLIQEKENCIESFQNQILEINKQHNEIIQKNQIDFNNQIEQFIKESTTKSILANKLLTERDEEIKTLKLTISDLKSEIASGRPSERKIFELAQSQANREAAIGANIDSRDIAFQQLQNALAAKDLELAHLQQIHSKLVGEMTELKRVAKREGVNMDYLKNIVLQYMSFPPSSPERNSLVPVLALLLQFTPAELKATEDASRVPLWSSRTIKEVKIPTKIGGSKSDVIVTIEDKSNISEKNQNDNTITRSITTPLSSQSIQSSSSIPSTYLQYNEV